MTIREQCKKIYQSPHPEARIQALKLVSSTIIDGNQFDLEAVKEGLGAGYYEYICNELSNMFYKGKKK